MYVIKLKGIKKLQKLTNVEYKALKTHPARTRKIISAIKIK